MGAICRQNINKSFGDTHVIKDVNIEIEDGGLGGPSRWKTR